MSADGAPQQGRHRPGVVTRTARWVASGWLRAGWHVPAQGAAMLAHALPGGPGVRPPVPVRVLGAAGVVAGVAWSTTAALTLGSDLTPAVTPRPGVGLRSDGVYGLSRHPLYTGLLVASAGAVLLRGRVSTLLAATALAGVLHVKAAAEEAVLAERFGAPYLAYRARVPRLVGVPRRG